MPELPEVETIRRGLAARVTGDRIASVWLSNKPQTFKSPPAEIAQALEGARIASVGRMGKHIVVDLEPDGTSPERDPEKRHGSSPVDCPSRYDRRLAGSASHAEVRKHTHAILRLESGKEIRFVDPAPFWPDVDCK